MGSTIIIFFIVMLILVVGGVAYVTNYGLPSNTDILQQIPSFVTQTLTDIDGDIMKLDLTKTVQNEDTQVQDTPTANSTSLVKLPDNLIQICYKTDKDGCLITGKVLLTNPVTGEFIKPYFYDYYITIECAKIISGFDYCNSDQVLNTGTTIDGGKNDDGDDVGGIYKHIWRPSNQYFAGSYDPSGNLIQKGLYDVVVYAKSEKLAETDRWEETIQAFQIDLRE